MHNREQDRTCRATVKLVFALALLLAGSGLLRADWLPGYETGGFRQRLSVTNTAHLTVALTNFPVLVRLTPGNFDCRRSMPEGWDVRFTAEDGVSALPFERESHDAANGLAAYWVRLPVLNAGTPTDFCLYYRPAFTNDAAHASNVWAGTGYAMVQHLEEPSGVLTDSTGNGYDVNNNGGIQQGIGGLIANAVQGMGGSLSLPIAPSPSVFSIWIKPTVTNSGNLVNYDWVGHENTYNVSLQPDGRIRTMVHNSNHREYMYSLSTVSSGEWCHVVHVYNDPAGQQALYVNGMLEASLYTWGIWFQDSRSLLGGFVGAADEIRVANVGKSADWIKTQYLSEKDALIQYGAPEGRERIPWLPDCAWRREITVTNYEHLARGLTNVPVLVSLTTGNFVFARSTPTGADVRFTGSDGVTPLDFEREEHDAASGRASYWVRLPVLYRWTNTSFYLYYGKSGTDVANPTNVWSSSAYSMVQHFKEPYGVLLDSTANGNNAVNNGLVTQGVVGRSGPGVSGAPGGALRVGLAPPYPCLFSAWIKPAVTNGGTLAQFQQEGVGSCYMVYLTGAGKVESEVHDGNNHCILTSSSSVRSGEWCQVVHSFGPAGERLYLNGVLEASSADSRGIRPPNIRNLAAGFQGIVDEVRFLNILPDEDWIKTQYLNERDALVRHGPDEPAHRATVMSLW